MNVLDTLIWLADFPVRHGYAIVFVAGFSLMGIGAFAFRSAGGRSSRLAAIREREGLPEATRNGGARVLVARVQRVFFRLLGVVMLSGLVLGILSLCGVPVTHAYINANGVPATGTVDDDWVTFSTPGGETYTVESNFFTPSVYPDRRELLPFDGQVVVRYLPSHPQAFIVDSTQLPE